jgi:hypothetical protein
MTTNKPKLKRTLAREILFFFAGLGLLGIVWGFLVIRNSYYENKASSCSDKIKTLKVEIDSLPKDYIKEFYEQTSRYFVVNYRLGQDSYAIPKEQEKAFLYDEFGIKKKVTLLPVYPRGYSYFKQSDPLNILGNDSSIVFDYVSIEKFREFVSSEDYQDKLYTVFANNSGKDEWVPPLDAIRADFDPMKPYNGIFQLGTLSDFKTKMKKGLSYNSTVVEQKNKIETDITDLKETIATSQNNKLSSTEIQQDVIYSAIVIGLLLYVLRLSIVLIIWALRTMKQNGGQ